MITLKLLESEQEIARNINTAISEYINDKLSKQKQSLVNRAKSLVYQWIKSQPEINSLSSSSPDSLAGYFGIPPSQVQPAIDSIISAIEKSVSVNFIPYSRDLQNGGLEVNFQPNTFENLIILPEGHVKYANGDLHWLNWLLNAGDTIIIVNYQYNPATGMGRSGLGTMIPGGVFRVPPQFSGTSDNNFITRALIGTDQETQIINLIKDILS
jgi:hypothetical protein